MGFRWTSGFGQFKTFEGLRESPTMGARDGIDIADRLLPLTDEMMRGGLTEVAFGASAASDDTHWTVNSQLNEPPGGFHLGIGAGEFAAHIDFIAPRATFL
jgi:hypothetical protein